MKLRCGVVGMGRGKLFAKFLAENEHCELVAVCDTSAAAIADFVNIERHTDYTRFLEEKLDVVAVISPGPVHAEQSIAALNRGANVLCETPCVYSVQEARNVTKAVGATGKSYMLAENYIWQKMTTILDDRKLSVWKALDKALAKYYGLLVERKDLIEETGLLNQQNEELKTLLNQYLQAGVNHELKVPPTQVIRLDM